MELQVAPLVPAHGGPDNLDTYEAACLSESAIEEGYKIERHYGTTYTNVVLVSISSSFLRTHTFLLQPVWLPLQVGNCVGRILMQSCENIRSIAIDDTFQLITVGQTRVFAFIVNHPRTNRGTCWST